MAWLWMMGHSWWSQPATFNQRGRWAMPEKLKSCICGGISLLTQYDGYQVECITCGCRGPREDTPARAMHSWNGMMTAMRTDSTYLEAMGVKISMHGDDADA
jgi:hypothetical protein